MRGPFTDEFMSVIERLYDYFVSDKNDIERVVLFRLAKVLEEMGEASEAILAYLKMQRNSKYERNKKLGSTDHISEEVLDVIITLAILIPMLGLDLQKALKRKVRKFKERYQLEFDI